MDEHLVRVGSAPASTALVIIAGERSNDIVQELPRT
jgi:hypothetical protein